MKKPPLHIRAEGMAPRIAQPRSLAGFDLALRIVVTVWAVVMFGMLALAAAGVWVVCQMAGGAS